MNNRNLFSDPAGWAQGLIEGRSLSGLGVTFCLDHCGSHSVTPSILSLRLTGVGCSILTDNWVCYLLKIAVCQRACRSGPSPVYWAGHCTVPGAHPSRFCSGTVFWHKARRGPSRGPHPFPGGSEVSRCFSSGHCPLGMGKGPGPGYWHHKCARGRSDSLLGWTWSALSPRSPGSTNRCGVDSL